MNLSEAADFAARWAENQRGMLMVSEALRGLGSMEQATKERKKALDEATKAHEAKKAEIASAEAHLAALNARHDVVSQAHSEMLNGASADAAAKAELIVAGARKQAEALIASAKSEADRFQVASRQAQTAAMAELEAAKRELAETRQAQSGVQAAHVDLAAKIDAMKATARGLLR